MIRRNMLIRQDQDDLLRKLPGNVSENVRTAIDEYLEKRFTSNAVASDSKSMNGGFNG